MRKSLLFGLAAAASVALAGPVFAQSDQTQSSQPSTSASSTSSTSTVTGTVVSSSDKQLVVDTPTGRETFAVSGTSNVPTGLTAGTQVTIEYRTSGDQRTVARVTTGSSSSSATSPYGSSSPSTSSTPPSTSSTSPYSSSSSSASSTAPRSSTSGTYDSGTSSQYGPTGTSTDRDNDVTRGRHDRRAGAAANEPGTTSNEHGNLPATASPAFLVGLLGLLSLGGSALLNALRRLL